MSIGKEVYTLTVKSYYDEYNQYYKNIITINTIPSAPFNKLVKQITMPKLSEFQTYDKCNPFPKCTYAIYKIDSNNSKSSCDLMTPDDIPELYNFLLSNGYKIDSSLTKMMNGSDVKMTNRLLCYVIEN
jgi:hypothetical protein